MTSSLNRTLALGPIGFMLSACATISVPDLPVQNPSITMNAIQLQGEAPTFKNANQALPLNTSWWTGFNDPSLTGLIETALFENRDLSIAQSNIEIAKANLARTALTQSYSTRSSASAELGRTARPNQNVTLSLSAGTGASWEYDAFGRLSATLKAAELDVSIQDDIRRDVAVMIAAETAIAYVNLRGAQRRLDLTRKNADLQKKSLELIEFLLENGRSTELDRHRAESLYRTTLASLPNFQATIDAAISSLAVLTGRSASTRPADLAALTNNPSDIPELQTTLKTGAPAELLRRRPDIRQAETEIERRLALSKVERARLFPTLVFNADILSLFNGTNRLDQLSSFGFGIGPTVQWDGPDLRGVRADIDIADAETLRAFTVYEGTVLDALANVETALSNSRNERLRRTDLIRAITASQKALDLASLRFEEGLDDFLDVLDAQRTLIEAEDRLALSRLQETQFLIQTYRELGGIEL